MKLTTKQLTLCAVLTAMALALSYLENFFPLSLAIPIPGIKLGLANIVTLFALYVLGPAQAMLILIGRCLLGAVFAGNMSALIFSLLALFVPYRVMSVYAEETAVCEIGVQYLRIIGVAYLFQTLSTAFSNVLSSTERVKIPLFASIASIITNTALNWILIYGKFGMPQMGIQGAAIASLIAAVVNSAVLLGVCILQRNVAVTRLKEMFLWSRSFVRDYFAKSTPLIINEAGYVLAVLIVNIVFGRQGEANLAAVTIFRIWR